METQWGTLLKHDIAFNIDREGPSPDRTSQMEREGGGSKGIVWVAREAFMAANVSADGVQREKKCGSGN